MSKFETQTVTAGNDQTLKLLLNCGVMTGFDWRLQLISGSSKVNNIFSVQTYSLEQARELLAVLEQAVISMEEEVGEQDNAEDAVVPEAPQAKFKLETVEDNYEDRVVVETIRSQSLMIGVYNKQGHRNLANFGPASAKQFSELVATATLALTASESPWLTFEAVTMKDDYGDKVEVDVGRTSSLIVTVHCDGREEQVAIFNQAKATQFSELVARATQSLNNPAAPGATS